MTAYFTVLIPSASFIIELQFPSKNEKKQIIKINNRIYAAKTKKFNKHIDTC